MGMAEDRIYYDRDHLSQLKYVSGRVEGFSVSLSLTALMTTGVEDRSGIRWGIGLNLMQTWDHWTIETGVDFLQARKRFGPGILYAGIGFESNSYGGRYYLTRYCQDTPQLSGMLDLRLKDFRIRFEDDLLAFPFTGFKVQDRYRTAALELRYKGFFVGTNVFTTDIDGLLDVSTQNERGEYLNGHQLSSPLYLGYADRDLLLRIGINHPIGGLIGQNLWHRLFFRTPDFKPGNYNCFFMQAGTDKPYTLY